MTRSYYLLIVSNREKRLLIFFKFISMCFRTCEAFDERWLWSCSLCHMYNPVHTN
jgi:hypothetical protein